MNLISAVVGGGITGVAGFHLAQAVSKSIESNPLREGVKRFHNFPKTSRMTKIKTTRPNPPLG